MSQDNSKNKQVNKTVFYKRASQLKYIPLKELKVFHEMRLSACQTEYNYA